MTDESDIKTHFKLVSNLVLNKHRSEIIDHIVKELLLLRRDFLIKLTMNELKN